MKMLVTKEARRPEIDTDAEVNILTADNIEFRKESIIDFFIYTIIGTLFGIVLIKTEVVSWYRIQEMFRFQSFHMFGVIGSALAVGILSVYLIKRYRLKSVRGEKIDLPQKPFHWGQVYGGLIFGAGWAITGACPGPFYALIGAGFTIFIVIFLSALLGTWVYGLVKEKLPH